MHLYTGCPAVTFLVKLNNINYNNKNLYFDIVAFLAI